MSADILPFLPVSDTLLEQGRQEQTFQSLLTRYNVPGPRYTSYPTIDQCSESVDERLFVNALQNRCVGGLKRPLSLYVHVPFCQSVCYYCACNKVITKKHNRVRHYLDCLEKEALMVAKVAPQGLSPVTQFHIGGGTPTFLSDEELSGLVKGLTLIFPFSAQAEMSIEVDPRTVDANRLLALRSMGFNRISFGVQDFDADVQKAVHREQSFESVLALVKTARRLGFESINVDLIYGLPLQTEHSFAHTLERLVALSPDRVALYGYAHLPERFKPQRRIHEQDLPTPETRIGLLALAIERLGEAGYDYIGMDHFAKPSDALAIAKRQGRLHRNFQGYTTQSEADLIGLGVSAISKVGAVLVQNRRELDGYEDAIERGHTAIFRGHVCSRDDLVRQGVIMALLCQGRVHFDDFSQSYWIDFKSYFKDELTQLEGFTQAGLLRMSESAIEVLPLGWFFVRPIAMCFDRYSKRVQMPRGQLI